MISSMALNFPNQSRSYDARHHSVRFWGHDDSREVTFVVGEDALTRIDQATPRSEEGYLEAFDAHRERILAAARKIYSRRGNGFHTLATSDF